MWLRLFLAAFALLVFPSPSPAAETRSQDPGQAILVLDASGSMWGQVDGRTKVEIARESIARLMEAWDPDIELGLMAYGHRRKSDCSDIELVLPVSRHPPETVVDAVNRLSAKGKTPLCAAVQQAAEALRYTENRATVILVSDGIETCGMDPCAVAEELEQAGVAFTAHVIGFDLQKEELESLRCLAEGTGGLFIEAKDAAGLTEALTAVEEEVAAAPPAPKVAPATRMAAVLTEGMDPIEDQEINWLVTDPEKGEDGSYALIKKARGTHPRIRLATGTYRVQAMTSLVTVETEIQVDAEQPSEHVVELNAGRVTLLGYLKEGGERLTKNIRWHLYANQGGQPNGLTSTNFHEPVFTLPAGTYEAVLELGLARASVPLVLGPGDILEKEVFLNAGQVRLHAVLQEGTPPLEKHVSWYLTTSEPNVQGEYETVDHNSYHSPLFTLGAGTHRFLVTSGAATKVFTVDIEPDRLMEKAVSLEAGQVTLIAVDKANGEPLQKARWTITRATPDSKGLYEKVTYSSYHTPTFTLHGGPYRVVVEHAGAASTAMIEVHVGERKEIRIGVQASP